MRYVLLVLCLIFALPVGEARAHGLSGLQVREIVLARDGADTLVFVRQPLPLLFSDVIVKAMRAQTPLRSPYLRLEDGTGGARYRADLAALTDDPAGFRDRLRRALVFRDGARTVTPQVIDFGITTHHARPAFHDAATARAALRAPTPPHDPAFGEAIVAYALRLPGPAVPTVASALPPLPAGPALRLQTHLHRDRTQGPLHLMVAGPLLQPTPFPATRPERARQAIRSWWRRLTGPGAEAR